MKHILKHHIMIHLHLFILRSFSVGGLLLTACQQEQAGAPNNGVPFVSAILPAQGRVGNKVNINGGNFSKNPQENQVFFNGTKAEVYVGIDEEMIVTVPRGATTGQVAVLVPGYDTVQGPVFTIEQFLKPVLYWHGGSGAFLKTTFNDEGQATTQQIFALTVSSSYTGFEYDADDNAFYVVSNGLGSNCSIQKFDLDSPGQAETLYDESADPVLNRSGILYRIVLDKQNGALYVTGQDKIMKGSMDGNAPLEVWMDGLATGELPYGITLSVGTTHLYWIHRRSPLIQIMRAPIASPSLKEVLYEGMDGLASPLDLVIDETRNRLYITDDVNTDFGQPNTDCIWQGSLDGSLPLKKIFEGDGEVFNPTAGLALDVENNQLYWRTIERDQNLTNNIVRADLDEENPRIDVLVSATSRIEYFTLSFEEDNAGGRRSTRASNGRGNGRSYFK
jgi:hypothetical protein